MPSEKTLQGRLFPFILLLLYGAVAGLLAFCVWKVPRAEIPDLLKSWVPWNLRGNFLFLVAGVLLCGRELRAAAGSLRNLRGAALAGLVLAAFLMVCFVAPRTGRIFYDEQIYTHIGQNMALADRAGFCNYGTFEYGEFTPRWVEYNKQPNGWPFLISLVFQALGVREIYAYLLNNLLFCGSLLLAFFLARRLSGGSFFSGFCATLVLALIPHNLQWSNTCTVEPSASFFTGLAVLFTVLFFQTGRTRYLFLLGVTLPLVCQMRTESLLTGLWVLAAFLVLNPREMLRGRFWATGLVAFFFLVPHLLHLYAFGDHSWGAEGARFSMEFFPENLKMNGLYFLSNRDFPLLFTVLFAAGLVSVKCPARWRFLLVFWFLLFWGVFLVYYAGGYRYGADVRYALVAYLPFSVLAGLGAGWLQARIAGLIPGSGAPLERGAARGSMPPAGRAGGPPGDGGRGLFFATALIVALILFSFLWHLPLVRQEGWEAWASRYDVRIAQRFMDRMPERSIVLTQTPSVFLLREKNAIQAYAGAHYPVLIHDLMVRYEGGVYFHHGYWCNTQDKIQDWICRKIESRYDLEPVDRAREQDYEYILYRMKRKE